MPSIQELRELTQKEKIEGRERPWGYASLQRGPSVYLTWLLVRTPITPNVITLVSIACGVAGSIASAQVSWNAKMAGFVLIYLNLLLDRVDGEVARYKHTYSLRGIYLDELNHLFIPLLFFFALAWGLAQTSASIPPLILILCGVAAGFASILLRITHNLSYQIFLKKYVKHREFFPAGTDLTSVATIRKEYSLAYPMVKVFHQFQDFFITLLVFAIVLIVERLWSPYYFLYPYSSYLLAIYAVYLWLIVFENIAKGLLTIEARMKELDRPDNG